MDEVSSRMLRSCGSRPNKLCLNQLQQTADEGMAVTFFTSCLTLKAEGPTVLPARKLVAHQSSTDPAFLRVNQTFTITNSPNISFNPRQEALLQTKREGDSQSNDFRKSNHHLLSSFLRPRPPSFAPNLFPSLPGSCYPLQYNMFGDENLDEGVISETLSYNFGYQTLT